jgi:Protein of unknown function, DUF547
MKHFCAFIVTILAHAAFAWSLAAASQAADLDRYFSKNDPKATMTVDHSAWQSILGRYVEPSPGGINLFAYGRVSTADRKKLKSYLAALQRVKVTALKPDEQRAFWMLDHYPVKSIRDISLSGFFTVGPWKKELVAVEGRRLSLDNIEHDILRKVWHDPRVHYAVNCASMGCPNLMAKPFAGTTLDRMLTQGARDYVNHPRGARVSGDKLYLSQIYSWYRKDFGTTDAEVIRHIAMYAEPKLKKQLAGIDKIAGYDYDWSLNEAK